MKNKESFKTIKDALTYVGGFSAPSKMPCPSYSLPASVCKTGAKLRKVKGSVCESCYGCKGNYNFPCVKNALTVRLAAIEKSLWVEAMVFAITKKKLSYYRLHDTGDVQSVFHLEKIVEIAKRCPSCKFWLPTKEIGFVREYLDSGKTFPENLTVRISGFMVDKSAPVAFAKSRGLVVSSVCVGDERATCRAFERGGECGECRACWNKDVFEVIYHKH